ncbi:MAG: nucleoside recognition domain-containing protein [Desulfovibrionaceae bacterium]
MSIATTITSGARALARAAREVLAQGVATCAELFKIMIPVIVLVKVLQHFELVEALARPLGPVMRLVGLPPEMGLVWATALVNNIYTAMIVFLPLNADAPLTAAQATVLGTMVLVAHGLPVELSIARKSGPRVAFQAFSRLFGALALGWLLSRGYAATGALQEPARVLLAAPGAADSSLLAWALGEAKNLFSIFLIVTALMAMMRLLDAIGVIALLNRLLRPVLRLIGIGPRASAITVVGLGLGISYGGGLIINEARSGNIDRRDIFYSLTLMGLTHSVIEDTLLMLTLGGHLSGLLWGRLGYSVLFVALLVQAARRLPPQWTDTLLWGAAKPKENTA